MSVTSNNPMVTCIECLPITWNKVNNNNKHIIRSLWHPYVKSAGGWWASYTYVVMVFSTKLNKISSTKVFLDGKLIHGHNMYVSLYSQMDPIVFIGNNPFTTNKIRSSRSPTYVASFLLDLLAVKKNRNCNWTYTCFLFIGLMIEWKTWGYVCYIF